MFRIEWKKRSGSSAESDHPFFRPHGYKGTADRGKKGWL